MADRHSSRRGRPRSTAGTVGSRPRPTLPQRPTGGSTPVPAQPRAANPHQEIVNELKAVAWRLTAAYCSCITVQAALEGQMAEQDGEFARCLRSGVSDPVSRQVERLQALAERVSGTSPRPRLSQPTDG